MRKKIRFDTNRYKIQELLPLVFFLIAIILTTPAVLLDLTQLAPAREFYEFIE